jgi:DUF917 family protein
MLVTEEDVAALARGCAVLGTGGGGAVDTAVPSVLEALRRHGPVPLVRLADLPDDGLVVALGGVGAPTVSHEMLGAAEQARRLRDEVERVAGRRVDAVMAAEIGGSNGVEPVAWAAQIGVPLLDADGMGRAFPEVHMMSMHVAGVTTDLLVIVDVVGNVSTLRPVSGEWAEKLVRAICVAGGASVLVASYLLTVERARGAVIEGSVSRALDIGRSVHGAGDRLTALRAGLGAVELIEGKVTDVERRTGGGFVRGSVVVTGTGQWSGRLLRVEIQNENLVALEDGEVRASVPDLISVVDAQTATAISTESLRYGQRVSVLAWPCDPLWRTPRGLEVAGPRAFGYHLDYQPVEELVHA